MSAVGPPRFPLRSAVIRGKKRNALGATTADLIRWTHRGRAVELVIALLSVLLGHS
jgi:hypothetical protein